MTNLLLLNVPFENNYKDTVYFDNVVQQTNYMKGKKVATFTDFSYQRKDQKIRIPAHIDTLYKCNYVMYQNEYFDPLTEQLYNKWFYAFIVDMEYMNDARTDITIQTDVMQTWMFDYTVKQSFIEREHVDDDSIGAHTVPEQVETGEYISNGDIENIEGLQQWAYIVNVTESPDGTKYGSSTIGYIASAGIFLVYDYSEIAEMQKLITSYDARPDAIVQIYLVPKALVDGEYDTETHQLKVAPSVKTFTKDLAKPSNIDGYTPKNKKLFTFPYTYLLFSNGNGSSNVLHYENFTGTKATFEMKGIPVTGGSMKCYPINYKTCYPDEGLIGGKYPICSWSNDLFTAWITSNAVNLGVGVVTDVAQIVAGGVAIASGGGALLGGGMITQGVQSVASTIGSVYQHSFISPSAKGNTNGGDILTSTGMNTFLFAPMSIKKEYARIIDEFFTMYGYKVNRVKVPEKNHRKNYWFTKTIDANIDGAIPNKDLQEIKNCYNNGITFWKSSATMGDYSVDNSPV